MIYPSIKQGGRLLEGRSESFEERGEEGGDRSIDLSMERGGRSNKERSVSFVERTKEGRNRASELQRLSSKKDNNNKHRIDRSIEMCCDVLW